MLWIMALAARAVASTQTASHHVLSLTTDTVRLAKDAVILPLRNQTLTQGVRVIVTIANAPTVCLCLQVVVWKPVALLPFLGCKKEKTFKQVHSFKKCKKKK
mmetsp:Transcript_80285/g.157512  ORF Transcript_80285/g.157512 Transcript_80285/m.157512 type:complete len:102 (+) Transcript_80285:977-1282(+)